MQKIIQIGFLVITIVLLMLTTSSDILVQNMLQPIEQKTEGIKILRKYDTDVLENRIETLCKKYYVQGLSIAVFSGDHDIIYKQSYGYSVLESKVPASEKTYYRCASVSKTVTAMLAMMLYDAGRLDLDADIADYMGLKIRSPVYRDVPITPKMLLTHTSSIIDTAYYSNSLSQCSCLPLEVLAKRGFYSGAKPGTEFIYSNLGAGMLTGVIEGASRERFIPYSVAVFENIGIDASYITKNLSKEYLANIYSGGILQFSPTRNCADEEYFSNIPLGQMYRLGHGDLMITAEGLAKVGMILANEGRLAGRQILRSSTVDRMHKPIVLTSDQPPIIRGLGVQRFDTILPGMSLWGHQGNAYGMIGGLFYNTKNNWGVAILTNGCSQVKSDNSAYDINKAIVQAVYNFWFR